MTNDDKYGFTAAVCFGLLLTSRPFDTAEKPGWGETSNVPKGPDVLKDLCKAITGSYCEPSKTAASKFRACASNGGNSIPLGKKEVADAYSGEVENPDSYNGALIRMHDFTEKNIDDNPARDIDLVKKFLGLIESDSCPDDTNFYIQENGVPLTKEQIRQENNFVLEAVIVGIFHFVLNNRRQNVAGKPVFKTLFSNNGEEWHYKGNLERMISRPITVKRYVPLVEDVPKIDDYEPEKEKSDSEIDQEQVQSNSDIKGQPQTVTNNVQNNIENHFGNETTINIEHLDKLKI